MAEVVVVTKVEEAEELTGSVAIVGDFVGIALTGASLGLFVGLLVAIGDLDGGGLIGASLGLFAGLAGDIVGDLDGGGLIGASLGLLVGFEVAVGF